MLGVLPREREVEKIDDGYKAYVELVRTSDGAIIGGASAICTRDERNWSNRDDYAVRSMAVTRATGKAFRLGFSWIMKLAGYEATPAEEMDFVEGQYEETSVPQDTPEKTTDKAGTQSVYDAVVDAGLAENEHAAKNALKYCKTGYDTADKAVAWMRKYRAWRDNDLDPMGAAQKANEGKLPE